MAAINLPTYPQALPSFGADSARSLEGSDPGPSPRAVRSFWPQPHNLNRQGAVWAGQ